MNNNVAIAKAYYMAIKNKDVDAVKSYYHPEVKVTSPLGTRTGAEAVLKDAVGFMHALTDFTIRAACGADNQVMLVIDVEFPAPVGLLPAAVLMQIEHNKIMSIELFFDGRRLAKEG